MYIFFTCNNYVHSDWFVTWREDHPHPHMVIVCEWIIVPRSGIKGILFLNMANNLATYIIIWHTVHIILNNLETKTLGVFFVLFFLLYCCEWMKFNPYLLFPLHLLGFWMQEYLKNEERNIYFFYQTYNSLSYIPFFMHENIDHVYLWTFY